MCCKYTLHQQARVIRKREKEREKDREKERERERKRETETERQRQRDRDRQRHIKTQRNTDRETKSNLKKCPSKYNVHAYISNRVRIIHIIMQILCIVINLDFEI